MSYQPPTAPMDSGSSPAQKPKKKRGCLGCGLLILGLIVALFIGSAVIAAIFGSDEEPTTPEPTTTVTATPSATPEPTPPPAPDPDPTTVPPPPPPPEPEPEPVEPEPVPEVPEVVPPAPVDPVAPPAVAPYPNCEAVRDAGAAPIRPGDPGWNPELDADGDGQACGRDR